MHKSTLSLFTISVKFLVMLFCTEHQPFFPEGMHILCLFAVNHIHTHAQCFIHNIFFMFSSYHIEVLDRLDYLQLTDSVTLLPETLSLPVYSASALSVAFYLPPDSSILHSCLLISSYLSLSSVSSLFLCSSASFSGSKGRGTKLFAYF